MIAHLDEESMELVVHGPYIRGPAVAVSLVGCELAVRNNIDHKRHSAARNAGQSWAGTAPMLIWDFLLKRSDGSVCMLHPNWSKPKVEYFEGVPPDNLEVPRNGLGGTNGRGYFRRRISADVTATLKFDKSKTPRGIEPDVIGPGMIER